LFVFFFAEFLNSLLLFVLFVLCVKCSNSFMSMYVYVVKICLK
jgi:hypothetical protein